MKTSIPGRSLFDALSAIAAATGAALSASAATFTLTNDDLGPLANSWTLAEDSTIVQNNSSAVWAGQRIVVDVAGRVLTIQKGAVGTAGYLGFLNDYPCTFKDSAGGGRIEVKPGAKIRFQGAFAMDGAEVVAAGGDIGFYVSNPSLTGTGTFSVSANSTFSFTRSGATTVTLPYPLVLSNGATLTFRGDMTSGNSFAFNGDVSGSGNFFANHKILRFAGDNTFTGKVIAYRNTDNATVATAVQFADAGAVSPNMTLVSATNAAVTLVKESESYSLPALDFNVVSGLDGSLSGGTNVTVAAIRKTGAGEADILSPVTVTGAVDLEAGTLKLARYAAAGVIGGRLIPDNWSSSEYGWEPAAYTKESRTAYTNIVELSASALTDASHELLTFSGPVNYKGNCNAMVVYDGYLWNTSPTDETWTVAGGVGGHTYFIFDGEHKYVKENGDPEPAQWNVPKMATFTATPGAHHFQIRFYGTSPIAPRGSGFSGWTWTSGGKDGGVRIDRQGRASTNIADYEPFADPGDGSFMTVSADGTPVGRAPYSFTTLNAAAGTTLDLFGNRLAVGDMSGFTTVTNSNDYHDGTLAVSGTWSLDGAAIAAGGATRVFGAVEWGSGATVSLSNIGNMARDVDYAVLETSAPMASAPGIASAEPEVANVRLALSGDGRRLVLTRKSSATVIMVK